MGVGTEAIEVVVGVDEVDLASGLLWRAGVTAIAEHPVVDRAAPEGAVRLRTGVPPGGVESVRAVVGSRWPVAVVDLDDDGLDAWRAHAAVVRVGRRLVIRPPWVPIDPVATDAVVVEIDPGRTFGHGAHPTTRLCLEAVERRVGDGGARTVLDVGCGSGVLAVAAARLGATSVVAVDVDPVAVAVTEANAERNGVAGLIDAQTVFGEDTTDPLGPVPGPNDLVVANLGAAALVALAPTLSTRVASGGALAVSGLLDPPPPRVAAAFTSLRVVEQHTCDGWTALVLAPDRRSKLAVWTSG